MVVKEPGSISGTSSAKRAQNGIGGKGNERQNSGSDGFERVIVRHNVLNTIFFY